MQQLWGGISAVFSSWNGKRAISYRRIEGIPDEWGTAVNVQTMVFGNMGFDSATGVAFTRDPGTGENVSRRDTGGPGADYGNVKGFVHAVLPLTFSRAALASKPLIRSGTI